MKTDLHIPNSFLSFPPSIPPKEMTAAGIDLPRTIIMTTVYDVVYNLIRIVYEVVYGR